MIILSDEQKRFPCWLQAQDSRVVTLTGHAGSGKTTTMNELRKHWPGEIVWCAPTHSAKEILSIKVKADAITITSALGLRPQTINGESTFLPGGLNLIDKKKPSLLVIDEASMVSAFQMALILESKAEKILFCGDPAQLPPIKEEASPVFLAGFPTYHLSKVFRQESGSPILALATDTREGYGCTALQRGITTINIADKTEVQNFLIANPDCISIAYTKVEVAFLNNLVRTIRNNGVQPENDYIKGDYIRLHGPVGGIHGPKNGEIVEITSTPVLTVFLTFAVWKMVITDNYDNSHTINAPKNEDISKLIERRKKALKESYKHALPEVQKAINVEVEMITNNIVDISHPYALTVHKAQGCTFEEVLFCYAGLGKVISADMRTRLAYTAITRASKKLTLAG